MNEPSPASLGKAAAPVDSAAGKPDDNDNDDEQGEVSLDDLGQAFAQLLGGDAPRGDTDDDVELQTNAEDQEADTVSSLTSETGAEAQTPDTEESTISSDAADADEDCVISPTTILEAVLFVGHPDNTPLSANEIAAVMRGVEPGEIEGLVKELNQTYEQLESPYHITDEGSGYRMALCEEYKAVREQFYSRTKEVRLSQPAVDILAVVAYNQPVTRQEIDEIRGRATGAVLTQLVRRGLLQVERREEKPRTTQYRTTQRFLEVFRLESLDDLPHSEELTG